MKFASMFALAVALTFGGSAFGAEPAAPEATTPAPAVAAPTTTAPSTTRAKGFRNRTKSVGLRAKFRNKFAR